MHNPLISEIMRQLYFVEPALFIAPYRLFFVVFSTVYALILN